MGKSFEIKTDKIQAAINTGANRRGYQEPATPAEAAERASLMRTQGRKGCKLPRINMAFTPENYEYIRVLARITGKSMTEFTNCICDEYREKHHDLYDQAKNIIDMFDK